MPDISFESLGFSRSEVLDRIVDKIAKSVLSDVSMDEEGDGFHRRSTFAALLETRVQQKIDASVEAIAAKHVLPNISEYVETLTLQQTNKWGEKVGDSVTFIEYLTQRAQHYLTEKVNYEGKTKEESRDSYSWREAQTRISYLINAHLQYSIETAMKDALKIANSAISTGITDAVKIKLTEITNGIKASVAVK